MWDSVTGPGDTLTAAHFPIAGDDVVGSQGIVRANFVGLDLGNPLGQDICVLDPAGDSVFFPERQVTGRNTPNLIMAIFNRDNFWDGRANRDFNGVTPAGTDDPSNPKIWIKENGGIVQRAVKVSPASLASQSVGPPNNEVEMSCLGRSFSQLGRKLLNVPKPLGLQTVAGDDSVLGPIADPMGGLTQSYAQLIQAAFKNKLHTSAALTPDGFTQMEANFSFFWGVSVMLWGSTLIPDNTPFDRFMEGDPTALTASQIAGMEVFQEDGNCTECHRGAEFTNASIQNGGNGNAFVNTGVTGPTGGQQPDNVGAFKSPTIRNTLITGPYFHTGKYLTLRQVVEFYDRGGDELHDQNELEPLGLSEAQKVALVDFMIALTDDDVLFRRAPFDGPSLNPPNGTPLPAVGAGGAATPIQPFLNADPHMP